jgi:hypothetical protein
MDTIIPTKEERHLQGLRDRFASVRKRFLDWFGQTEPHWDKAAEDKEPFETLLERWEKILNHKPTSFPSVHDSSAFKRFEARAIKEGIIKE